MKVYNDTNLSILSYNFYGISMQETECFNCHTILYNYQFFQIITFDLYSYKDLKFSIYQGFYDYIKEKIMNGDNQCYCQRCKKLTDSVVGSKVYCTPPYLIIFFDYGKNKKYVPKEIDFGVFINLTGFTVAECTDRNYELIMVNSYYKNSDKKFVSYINDKKSWFEFDDTKISEISFEKVTQSLPAFLIYQKIK